MTFLAAAASLGTFAAANALPLAIGGSAILNYLGSQGQADVARQGGQMQSDAAVRAAALQ